MTSVCALVVTRDRKQLLGECLTALLSQTLPVSRVIVFDNASSDGTREWLDEAGLLDDQRVRFVRSEVNVGGAAGYAEVLALGSKTDAEWLWLMDDDAEPRPDSLERLLGSPAASDAASVAVCSAVLHPDGTLDRLHRCRWGRFITPLEARAYVSGRPVDVDCASFVGLMVRTDAVRAVGLPRAEFFLGYDDAEYSLRLRARGEIRLVAESIIVHKIVIGGGRPTARGGWANRILGAQYTPSPWGSYWKDLYRIRNFLAVKAERGELPDRELALIVLGYVAKTLLYDERPLRRIPWIVRYARKGRRQDFRGPSPEGWAAYAATHP
ncbi:MAG: glycosyltransferase [Solirubrobacteraceae bacterium]